jgi:hypothetical protein
MPRCRWSPGSGSLRGSRALISCNISLPFAYRVSRIAYRVSRIADGDEYDFDPYVGESVLRYALGQDIRITADAGERFRAVIALLGALAESELPSEEDVDYLLAEARALADQWAVNDQPMR